MKTKEQWSNSRQGLTQFLSVGDEVDVEMYYYFIEVLPPACMRAGVVQIGEPSCHSNDGKPMFETLEKHNGHWIYTGRKTTPDNVRMQKEGA